MLQRFSAVLKIILNHPKTWPENFEEWNIWQWAGAIQREHLVKLYGGFFLKQQGWVIIGDKSTPMDQAYGASTLCQRRNSEPSTLQPYNPKTLKTFKPIASKPKYLTPITPNLQTLNPRPNLTEHV